MPKLIPSIFSGFSAFEDKTGVRALDTVYQNTSGKPIAACIQTHANAAGLGTFLVGQADPPTVSMGQWGGAIVFQNTFIIPSGWYYKLRIDANNFILDVWAEST